ncbi:hypothetical protein NIES4101_43430 [Calothrix sp. NIES-4101]|nr:hypothetical protein NIES4101_43430 [Calothrix sp. NIES-4101]
MQNLNDESLIRSWNQNAPAWITAIENEEIESRKTATNQAIIDAIMSYSPKFVLDIGCGEGWLTRELTRLEIEAIGIDAVPRLIASAKAQGNGKFLVCSYEDILIKDILVTTNQDRNFDAVVCNFSLLGEASVDNLVHSIPKLLKNNGLLFIQTLHTATTCHEQPYVDGWRQESWNGFNSQFVEASPWYFRKLETWIQLLISSNFSILECREPIYRQSQKPASIIFVARHSRKGHEIPVPPYP